MGFIDTIIDLFGSNKVTFGKINPENLDHMFEADWDIDQGERAEKKGEKGALDRALTAWGFSRMSQWENARGAMHQKHSGRPDYQETLARVNMAKQMVKSTAKMNGTTPPIGPSSLSRRSRSVNHWTK
jgi:hypothetical protein